MEQFVLRGPADLVTATPYLLGYQPADSMMVMAFRQRQVLAVARADLPEPAGAPTLEGLDDALDPMSGQGATTMAFLGYGPAARVDPLVPLVKPVAERHRLQVIDMLRVDDGRWWSYICELGCCPPEGTRFDPQTSRLAAGCAAAGLMVWPSRADLEQQVAPIGGPARVSMSRATVSAVRRFAALAGRAAARPGRDSWEARVLVRARRTVQTALTRYEQGGRLDDGQMAWLSVLLRPTVVRDAIMRTVTTGQPEPQLRLWSDATKRVDPSLAAAPACLLAYAAWRAGQQALAQVAVERALAAAPGDPWAGLLWQGMRLGPAPASVDELVGRVHAGRPVEPVHSRRACRGRP